MTVKNSDPEANIPKGKGNSFLEWTRTILPILISWPTFALLFLFTFKSSLVGVLDRFSAAEGSKAEFGPVKVEIGRTVLPPQYQNGLPTVTTTVKVDYFDRVSQIKDEGTTGSTVGYSTSYALEIILHDSDFKGREVFARGIYEGAKLRDEWEGTDYQGTSLLGAIKALMDEGFYWEKDWPNDQAIKPNNASPAMKISGYKQVDSISDAILQLKAGSPVVVSISLSKDFFYPENGMITLPANPIVEGMGTICLVGYNQETKMFKFAQSWGTGWGDSGFGHISENDLKAVWGQGFVINVSSK